MPKVGVHPVSLGPNRTQHIEIFTAFYSLGCLASYAKVHDDGALNETFEFGRVTPTSAREIPDLVDRLAPDPAVVLLSSYVWNHTENMRFASDLKQRNP